MISILRTGDSDIDRQHTQLVSCLDELRAFIDGSYSFAAGFTAIQSLIDYTETHFAFEEDRLRQCGYPELDEHIEQHRTLVAEVFRQWERVEKEGADVAREVVETIERWIIDHINISDFKFAEFVRPL